MRRLEDHGQWSHSKQDSRSFHCAWLVTNSRPPTVATPFMIELFQRFDARHVPKLFASNVDALIACRWHTSKRFQKHPQCSFRPVNYGRDFSLRRKREKERERGKENYARYIVNIVPMAIEEKRKEKKIAKRLSNLSRRRLWHFEDLRILQK